MSVGIECISSDSKKALAEINNKYRGNFSKESSLTYGIEQSKVLLEELYDRQNFQLLEYLENTLTFEWSGCQTLIDYYQLLKNTPLSELVLKSQQYLEKHPQDYKEKLSLE